MFSRLCSTGVVCCRKRFFPMPWKTTWLSVESRWKLGRRESPREQGKLKGSSRMGVCACVPVTGKPSRCDMGKFICIRSCDILLQDKLPFCPIRGDLCLIICVTKLHSRKKKNRWIQKHRNRPNRVEALTRLLA